MTEVVAEKESMIKFFQQRLNAVSKAIENCKVAGMASEYRVDKKDRSNVTTGIGEVDDDDKKDPPEPIE